MNMVKKMFFWIQMYWMHWRRPQEHQNTRESLMKTMKTTTIISRMRTTNHLSNWSNQHVKMEDIRHLVNLFTQLWFLLVELLISKLFIAMSTTTRMISTINLHIGSRMVSTKAMSGAPFTILEAFTKQLMEGGPLILLWKAEVADNICMICNCKRRGCLPL